jgi:3-hydroxyisobutyrate dehydrogenase-like beta-hydroxyacid dehydrogenase
MADKAGIVGIGIMGSAMANNMIQSGLTVVGYDPSPAAQENFVRMGGRLLESPRAVADEALVTVLSLPSPQALADAVFGRAGFVEARSKGQIAIECSTLELAAKRQALERMQSVGMTLLDQFSKASLDPSTIWDRSEAEV